MCTGCATDLQNEGSFGANRSLNRIEGDRQQFEAQLNKFFRFGNRNPDFNELRLCDFGGSPVRTPKCRGHASVAEGSNESAIEEYQSLLETSLILAGSGKVKPPPNFGFLLLTFTDLGSRESTTRRRSLRCGEDNPISQMTTDSTGSVLLHHSNPENSTQSIGAVGRHPRAFQRGLTLGVGLD